MAIESTIDRAKIDAGTERSRDPRKARRSVRSIPRSAAGLVLTLLLACPLATAQTASGSRVVIRQLYGGGGSLYAQDYVELFNRSDGPVSLAGWSLQYASATGSGAFASNGISPLAGTLDPGQSLLVAIGSLSPSGLPLPSPTFAGHPTLNLASASGKLALVRSTVGLPCHGGSTLPCDASALASIEDLVGYGTATFFEGTAAAPPASSTLAVSRAANGCRDANQNGADFATTAPSPRTQDSPAILCAESEACGAPATPIHSIQGAGASSPLLGSLVSVEAIVTARFQGTAASSLQGFFVQASDAEADLDPTTSEGLFVSESASGGAATIAVGARVRVAGSVVESAGATSVRSLGGIEVCALGHPLPTPATLMLPVPGVSADDLAAAAQSLAAHAERFEGMQVRVSGDLAVADLSGLERSGQLVLQAGPPLRAYTHANPPNVPGFRAYRIETARRRVVLDDADDRASSAWANGHPLPHPTPGLSLEHRLRAGDTIRDLAGILEGTIPGSSEVPLPILRLRPQLESQSQVIAPTSPRPAAPPAVGGTLRLASLNVLNYFATLDTTASGSGPCGPNGVLDCRGADSLVELERQTAKLVAALCRLEPDVAALMELENDVEDASLRRLVAALNSVAGCGPFDFVSTGAMGSDAIRVGFLFKPGTVERVGAHAILDQSVDSRFDDVRNRPVLAQTFREVATGDRFTLAAAHLKSKGSSCSAQGDPDLGDGQGHCNQTRTRAARALVDWLASDPTGSLDADFAVLGDLNAYPREDPIAALLAGADDVAGSSDDWVDLLADSGGRGEANGMDLPTAPGTVATHRFDGASGRLDHALASRAMADRVTAAAGWSINADEPPAFDYDDAIVDAGESIAEAKPGALPLYAADEFRSSDHDPIVFGLIALPEPRGASRLGFGACAILARAFNSRRRARARRQPVPPGQWVPPTPVRNVPPPRPRAPADSPESSPAAPP